jgi:hypothetical protein
VESLHDQACASALGELSRFRREFYTSLTTRADALFELTDGAPRGAGVPDGGERPPIFPSS